MSARFPEGFLWGASTSPHQVEGNNVTSDMWTLENQPDSPMQERSGDACDSLHRWPEDLDLLASVGLNAYRFGIEWARVEPEPGRVSAAMLQHYRRMISGCIQRGITPVVTLHHFSSPRWFRAAGGWRAHDAPELFARYAATVLPILEGVEWVCTINEPNMIAIMQAAISSEQGLADLAARMPPADEEITDGLIRAHRAARAALSGVRSGWTVANLNVHAVDGAEVQAQAWRAQREDAFVDAAAGDDFIGVQAYTRTRVGPDGQLPPPDGASTTQTGWEVYPDGLEQAVRYTAQKVPGTPILVTENGIATGDDRQRIDYTRRALAGLARALQDGIDVRGYLHWSLLDNYEWGSFTPTFGLIAVDRQTFSRTLKPSARWLGEIARAGGP